MSPLQRQLVQLKLTLEAAGTDGVFGADAPYFRHHRFRHTTPQERAKSSLGCIAIRFDDNSADTDQNESMDVQKQRLGISLVYDYESLPGDDPTGVGDASLVLLTAVKALRTEDSLMLQTADEVLMGELVPAEESAGDSARLEQRLIVVYRVNSVDPTHLYAPGA
jgi:hypothetical protein